MKPRKTSRPRRDQPRRLEVGLAICIGILGTGSARLVPPPALDVGRAREQLQQWSKERAAAFEELWSRLRPGSSSEDADQPEFAGTWRTSRSVDLDHFLEHAMGVGQLKRTIATRASQTQKLYQKGEIIHLEISDRRGTAKYTLRPDGRTHSGTGYMKMPIKQKAKWGRDGSLLVEERYATHLVRAASNAP